MLIIDAIYKTNKFQILLINIIKITGINRNFYTTNIFLTDEKEKDYNIIFSDLKILYDFWKLSYPVTFITDSYKIEIKTLKKIFPEANHILYIIIIIIFYALRPSRAYWVLLLLDLRETLWEIKPIVLYILLDICYTRCLKV